MRWVALAGGILLVGATYSSVVGTFIVPRDTPARIAYFVARVMSGLFRSVARLLRTYEAKDRFLAFQAPWFLVVLLISWLILLMLGFASILWGITPELDYKEALREAGSSMLTLGFASTESGGPTAVDFVAAASGFVAIALLIGYLPVLYGAYNRRELSVTMLEARAGAPAWGPEILWRHHRIGILDSLSAFYEHWETWCADVAETHATYPVLLYFRSPHPMRSWLTGLLAVLDSAALYNALCPQTAPSQARLCLRMGFTGLRTIADTLYIKYDPDPRPDTPIRLTYEEYMRGVNRLIEIGFPLERTPEDAWADFKGWRVNYEEIALAIARNVVATPGPWAGLDPEIHVELIPTKRPVDRTPREPEGTEFTRPGTYEES